MTEENDDNIVAALAAALSTEPRRPSVEQILHDRSRTHEVARMLSGAKVTDASQQHAAQMIAASR